MALTYINMKGDVKQVAEHLAFDTQLQKSMNFFPCDENGVAINQPQQTVEEIKKNDVAPVENEIEIHIPAGVEIVNPLEEEKGVIEIAEVEKPKRGRKPNVNKQ